MTQKREIKRAVARAKAVVVAQKAALRQGPKNRGLLAKLRAKRGPVLCKKDFRTTLSERVFAAGYVVRRERIGMVGCPAVEMNVAYTPNGDYIGDPKTARRLIVKRGIRPQLRTPTSNVCSIGYNAAERKWYGWSHRAIFGFGIGSTVKKGDCHAGLLAVGQKAKTLADAKQMAEAFAESVS